MQESAFRVEREIHRAHHFHRGEVKISQGIVADGHGGAVLEDASVAPGKAFKLFLEFSSFCFGVRSSICKGCR